MDNSLIVKVNESADRVRAQKDRQERINARKQEELETLQAGLFCFATWTVVFITICVVIAVISHFTGIVFD